ncbi:grpIintron_endo, group I intron endonuclease [uncultured Caudovirales phage]|uniref:GrpIintron_endo, group I intron endonuclease n=1 Tax=uncultured Caudovirales phage TaxID=2100421 RepID=A0A6J5KP06_9CAUD|nr:grpIintron_endo, group I intron endonuclease [uncultured Caudovirales phage]
MLEHTIPFIYKWTELSTGMWYIGSHYKKGCHPNDGYICSSKTVLPLIQQAPENWMREILEVCENPTITMLRESDILTALRAREDPMSYNKTNADGKFCRVGPHSEETKQKMRTNHKDVSGENNPMFGKPGGMKGKHHSPESKKKTSLALAGRSVRPESAKKISESLTGLSWINDGTTSKRVDLTHNGLPEGWSMGLLIDHARKISDANSRESHWTYGTSRPQSTREKISKSLLGRQELESTRQKKKEASKNRPLIECSGCGKLYRSCHKRHHLMCIQEIMEE